MTWRDPALGKLDRLWGKKPLYLEKERRLVKKVEKKI